MARYVDWAERGIPISFLIDDSGICSLLLSFHAHVNEFTEVLIESGNRHVLRIGRGGSGEILRLRSG